MDRQSVICCPELKKINCRYCKESGHTISYCKILKAKERSASLVGISKSSKSVISSDGFTMVVNMKTHAKKKIEPESISTISGMFAGLMCDDDDDHDDHDDDDMKVHECADPIRSPATLWPNQSRVAPELVVTSAYLQAVKYGVRAAPELEKEFNPDTTQLKFVYERGATGFEWV
jgi:hypothetical protein